MSRPARGAVIVTAIAVALLAGCSLPDGPPGEVVSRADRWSPATKSRAYFLTVRTAQGEHEEFQVHIQDYDRCRPGSAYPDCTKG